MVRLVGGALLIVWVYVFVHEKKSVWLYVTKRGRNGEGKQREDIMWPFPLEFRM